MSEKELKYLLVRTEDELSQLVQWAEYYDEKQAKKDARFCEKIIHSLKDLANEKGYKDPIFYK